MFESCRDEMVQVLTKLAFEGSKASYGPCSLQLEKRMIAT